MQNRNAAHGASTLGVWFAERHVYLRSGSDSSYVLLSRPLQIGVTIAIALVVAGLAYAGYSAIASRLHALEQQREIARLESVIQTLQSAADDVRQDVADTAPRVGLPAAPAQIEEVAAGVDQTEVTTGLEQRLADAGEQAGRLAAQLAAAETAAAAVAPGSLQPAQAGSDDAAVRALAQLKADPDALQELRRYLASAVTTVAVLNAGLDAAQDDLAAARRDAPAAASSPDNAGELARLRAQLRRANQRIDQLQGVADLTPPTLAPARPPPAPAPRAPR